MRFLTLIILQFLFFAKASSEANIQDISDTIEYTIYDSYEELEQALFQTSENEVILVNFWATWCGPCVKELPLFELLNKTKGEEKLKIILVSLDFTDQLRSRYVPFIEKHALKSELAVLADMDANKWIDMVSPSWTGTIPATIALKGKQKVFTDQEFESIEEIKAFIKKLD